MGGAEGVVRSGVPGWRREERAENRRSTAVDVSDHLVERRIELRHLDRTAGKSSAEEPLVQESD